MERRIIFDIESTGTDTSKDRIVQISAVKTDDTFYPVEEQKTVLINPLMPIPASASKIHGITDDMVKDCRTFAAYAKSLHAFFQGCSIWGYNSNNFDVLMLNQEFSRCGIYWPTNEPMIDAYKIYMLKEPRTLAGAVKFYTGNVFDDGHDAGRDVLQTKNVLIAQMQAYPELNQMDMTELELFCFDGKKRVDLAGKLIRNEHNEIVYGFGKDKDKVVFDNRGFGEWMMKQNSFPTETIQILQAVLNGKLK